MPKKKPPRPNVDSRPLRYQPQPEIPLISTSPCVENTEEVGRASVRIGILPSLALAVGGGAAAFAAGTQGEFSSAVAFIAALFVVQGLVAAMTFRDLFLWNVRRTLPHLTCATCEYVNDGYGIFQCSCQRIGPMNRYIFDSCSARQCSRVPGAFECASCGRKVLIPTFIGNEKTTLTRPKYDA